MAAPIVLKHGMFAAIRMPKNDLVIDLDKLVDFGMDVPKNAVVMVDGKLTVGPDLIRDGVHKAVVGVKARTLDALLDRKSDKIELGLKSAPIVLKGGMVAIRMPEH